MARKRRARRLLLLIPTPREAEILLGASVGRLRTAGNDAPRVVTIAGRRVGVVQVGLGLAAAGASSARWFSELRPEAAALVGLCGTFDRERLPVGALLEATRVACDGIGAGEGESFETVGEPPRALACAKAGSRGVRGELLSVAAAAGDAAMARRRRLRHPRALAEEMEGYAVAFAARQSGVPLAILRGASNVAGDRDHAGWKIDEALAACRAALAEWVARGGVAS